MKIHLIDDDEILNALHKSVLLEFMPNAEIKDFRSGQMYLDYAESKSFVEPDYALVDIRMPELDGLELIKILESKIENPLRNSKVYVVSSTLNQKDKKDATSFKTVDLFIEKPIPFDKVSRLFNL
ncbi:MAG: response regulator [Bacteroidia bacterium]